MACAQVCTNDLVKAPSKIDAVVLDLEGRCIFMEHLAVDLGRKADILVGTAPCEDGCSACPAPQSEVLLWRLEECARRLAAAGITLQNHLNRIDY